MATLLIFIMSLITTYENANRTYFFLPMVTRVTRTLHKITLHVYCLSYYVACLCITGIFKLA